MSYLDLTYGVRLYELQQLKIKESLLETELKERERQERRDAEIWWEIEEQKRSILAKTLELSRK